MVAPTIPLPAGVDVSLGSEVAFKARTLKAQFGDGYTQRSGDGQNAVSGNYSVSFNTLTRVEAQILLDFFTAQAGYKAFYYTIKGESTPRLWTCEDWSREHVTGIIDNVKATWIEVFTA
jgi:phage-related protein